MIKAGKLQLYILFILTVFILTGCAGPKSMSTGKPHMSVGPKGMSIKKAEKLHILRNDSSTIPYYNNLSFRINAFLVNNKTIQWENKLAGDVFTELLIEKLTTRKLFDKISVISSIEPVHADLLLEITIENIKNVGYWQRSIEGNESEVFITGRIIDVQKDSTLFLFSNARTGSGGVLGTGGLLSPNEKTMIKQLMEWLAEDIVDLIEARLAK